MTTFLVLVYGYLLSQFFRSALAVIAPELARDLSLTAADLGAISSAWFVVFAIAQFPVGAALDRIGPRRTVSVLTLATVAGCILFAFAESRMQCMLAMGLIGLGCAPVFMGALYLFGMTYPPERFALLSSWLIASGSLGNLLAATPLSAAAGSIGWRWTFMVLAALCLLSALLVALLVRDPQKAPVPRDGRGSVLDVLAIRGLWPLVPLTIVSYAIVATLRGLWIGPYLDEVHGLTGVARGNAVLAVAFAMSVGALAYGPLDQWFGTRKWVVAAGSAVTVGLLGALAVLPSLDVAWAVLLLALTCAVGLNYAVLMAHGRAFLPNHLLGRGMTFLNFLFIGGAGALQWLSGLYVTDLRADGLSAADIYAALHGALALALASSLLVYLLSRERP